MSKGKGTGLAVQPAQLGLLELIFSLRQAELGHGALVELAEDLPVGGLVQVVYHFIRLRRFCRANVSSELSNLIGFHEGNWGLIR